MSLAGSRHASWALAAVSFAESSFFPIPPDVLLMPMVLADRKSWIKNAAIATASSVLGALLGYAIGAALFEIVGRPLLEFYHATGAYEALKAQYNATGAWAVLAGAVTFLPYKVFTIFSGSVAFSLPVFIGVSIIGRGIRFFAVAGLLYKFGPAIRDFIEKRLGLMFILFVLLLGAGFFLITQFK